MDVHLLIAEVYKRRTLWKQGHPHHHHRGVLDKLWSEVGEIVGVTPQQARKRWKNLKDHYRNELRRVTESEENEGQSYRSFWIHYDELSFLTDQIKARKPPPSIPSFLIAQELGAVSQQSDESYSSDNKGGFTYKTENVDLEEEEKFVPGGGFEVSDSDDYHFFMSLVPHMRKFDTIQKLTIRNKIHQVIIDHAAGLILQEPAPELKLFQ